MANGKEIAAPNVNKLDVWIEDSHAAGDWSDYIRQEDSRFLISHARLRKRLSSPNAPSFAIA